MADDVTLNSMSGGDTARAKDRTTSKTQIVALDLNPAGSESLMAGAMPVTDNAGSLTVDNGGTFAVQDSEKVADNAPFTDGTTPVQPAGYIYDEVAGTGLTENDAGAARMDVKRAQIAVLEDATTRGQRATVTASNALKVDGSAVTQPVSGTVTANAGSGPWPVTDNAGSLTVDNDGTFAIQDSQKLADNAGFTDGTTPVQPAGFIFDEVAGTALTENDVAASRIDSKRAQVMVIEDTTTRGQRATVTGANALKVDGSAVTQPVSGTVTANLATGTNTVGDVGIIPRTSGGLTTYHLVSAATTNAQVVKASAGQLFGWYIYNSNASMRKVAFHNTASTPTAGASIFFTLPIPGNSGANVFSNIGIAFSTGIAITTVTGLADSDSTGVAANDLIINLFYA